MPIASLPPEPAAHASDSVSGSELLAWRRSMLKLEDSGGSASGLDWLLDLAGGLGWPELQSLWLHPQRRVQLRCSLRELETLWRRHLLEHEPLQYLVGRCPWRDLELSVAPGVLIPRQETEQLLDLALSLAPAPPPERPLVWADLGTGSGCLAAALGRACPGSVGLAVDACAEALGQAGANLQALLPPGLLRQGQLEATPASDAEAAPVAPAPAEALASRQITPPGPEPERLLPGVRLRQGSWWQAIEPWWGQLDLVVSNPPYIPSQLLAGLEPLVRDHEPWLALDGGPDGLTAIRQIAAAAGAALAPGGVLLLEHHHDQSEAVLQLLAAGGLQDCRAHRDLEGVLRFASGRRPHGPGSVAADSVEGMAS